MKFLLLALLIQSANAKVRVYEYMDKDTRIERTYKDLSSVPKDTAEETFRRLNKIYGGKKTVQKLNKIIYVKLIKKDKTRDIRCLPLRAKSPTFVCRMGVGYSEACYVSGTDISFKVSCKAYDDQRVINSRYGDPMSYN